MKKLSILLICLSFFFASEVASQTLSDCTYPVTLTGEFSKVYWQTKDVFEIGNGGRSHTYSVSFDQKLCFVPKVMVALNGLDSSKDANQRLTVKVADVKETGFNVVFNTWADTKIYMVSVSWIAVRP